MTDINIWKQSVENRLSEGEYKMNAIQQMANENSQALQALAEAQGRTEDLLQKQIDQTNRMVTFFEGFEDIAKGASEIIAAIRPIVRPILVLLKGIFYIFLFIYFIFHFDWGKAVAILLEKL